MSLNVQKAAVGVLGFVAFVGTSSFATAQITDETEASNRSHNKRVYQEHKAARTVDRTDRFEVYGNGRVYRTDGRGADLLRSAIHAGYRSGYTEGRSASSHGKGESVSISAAYKNASLGYHEHVDHNQYKYYFREGFRRGYDDGYHSRSVYGYDDGSELQVMVSVLNELLTVAAY